ncbi:alkaline phosphatase, tissue-nonspecific isozyme-like isoform X2 [Patiria miniata]|uniref:alkaline phosphatase n=1 Tax=Patiria miniata TaxID=46514 RepID=A0A914BIC6_PATMI|nr:alkaline phosphatase, tissue-nonspecific isozyme-like isoform X2 [Patiria miniata]
MITLLAVTRIFPTTSMGLTTRLLVPVACVLFLVGGRVQSQDAKFWNDQAKQTLQNALNRERTLNKNVAKNVVFFLGDGMGMSTVTAARIMKGQNMGNPGEETVLKWEEFPSVALSKTYSVDKQVGSSGSSATACFCGVKANDNMLGLDSRGRYGDCASSIGAAVDSFLILAHRAGKSTGFATTSRVTHATPAALYAHAPSRDWENDGDIPTEEAAKGCTDIGAQLVENGHVFDVVLGGGRRELTGTNQTDPEYPDEVGHRTDGRNIIEEWLSKKAANRTKYVWNLDAFSSVDPAETDALLGLFERGHMHFEADRADDEAGEPSIAEMTAKAIKILQKDPDGYFLVVEGLYNDGEGSDGMPYTTLNYADGPGGEIERDSYNAVGSRRNLTNVNTGGIDFKQSAIVPREDESHAGEDVAIYANGPMAHLFHGVHEQNYMAHVVRYAACLDYKEHCQMSSAPSRDGFNLWLILVTVFLSVRFWI